MASFIIYKTWGKQKPWISFSSYFFYDHLSTILLSSFALSSILVTLKKSKKDSSYTFVVTMFVIYTHCQADNLQTWKTENSIKHKHSKAYAFIRQKAAVTRGCREGNGEWPFNGYRVWDNEQVLQMHIVNVFNAPWIAYFKMIKKANLL